MANIYKNAFYDPSVTTAVTVYTVPANRTAIVKNIQITNEAGSKNVKVYIYDSSTSSTNTIAFASISGPTICNLAKGPIILEENDALLIDTTVTSSVYGTISILEVNRD